MKPKNGIRQASVRIKGRFFCFCAAILIGGLTITVTGRKSNRIGRTTCALERTAWTRKDAAAIVRDAQSRTFTESKWITIYPDDTRAIWIRPKS